MQSAKQLTGNVGTGTTGHGLFGIIGIAKELVKSASVVVIAIHEKPRWNTRNCFSVIAGLWHLLARIQRRLHEERKHIISAITAAVAASIG